MKSFSRFITIYLTFASCFDVTLAAMQNDYNKYDKHLLNDIDFRVSAFEVTHKYSLILKNINFKKRKLFENWIIN